MIEEDEKGSPNPKLNYSDDQWSPNNLDRKKSYEWSFLLQLKSMTESVKKPNLPDLSDYIIGKVSCQHAL